MIKKQVKPVKLCTGCGNKIPVERAKALPNTELCVKCAAENPGPVPTPDDVCAIPSIMTEEID